MLFIEKAPAKKAKVEPVQPEIVPFAGVGRTLTGPPKEATLCVSEVPASAEPTRSASSDSPPSTPPPPVRQGGPDPNIALALARRLEGKSNKTTAKATLYDIMAQEGRDFSNEIQLKEQEKGIQKQGNSSKETQEANPYKELEDAQLFTCPSLDLNEAMTFEQLMSKVKEKIFINLTTDSILLYLTVLKNCNRTSSRPNVSNVESCCETLKAVLTKLKDSIANEEDFEKYSRLRRSKLEARVLNYTGGLDVLYAIGFTTDEEDPDWLIYDVSDDVDVGSKLETILELLESTMMYRFELDRQIKKYVMEEKEEGGTVATATSLADLELTSTDVKQYMNTLEKKREIGELFASKATKERLLSNAPASKCAFTRLRFRFTAQGQGLQIVEAYFYSNETLSQVKDWFAGKFSGQITGEKEITFKMGPVQYGDESLEQSLEELKLVPAATLTVIRT